MLRHRLLWLWQLLVLLLLLHMSLRVLQLLLNGLSRRHGGQRVPVSQCLHDWESCADLRLVHGTWSDGGHVVHVRWMDVRPGRDCRCDRVTGGRGLLPQS